MDGENEVHGGGGHVTAVGHLNGEWRMLDPSPVPSKSKWLHFLRDVSCPKEKNGPYPDGLKHAQERARRQRFLEDRFLHKVDGFQFTARCLCVNEKKAPTPPPPAAVGASQQAQGY